MRQRLLIFLILILLIPLSRVMAAEMESPNYRLEIENFEQEASPSSDVTDITSETPVLPQNLVSQFNKNGYAVLTSDEDLILDFTFTLSKTDIAFENPNKTTAEDELTISVNAASTFGYQIVMIKKKSILHTSTKDEIPQTLCNDQWNPCTVRFARPWDKESSYGIGYKLEGKDSPADFQSDKYYRPFAESEPITIMQNSAISDSREGKLKIKFNPDPTQPEGTYEGIYELQLIPRI